MERNEPRLENIGLSLREAKQLLAAIQTKIVEQQVADYLETQRPCPRCGRIRGLNGSHEVTFQTLFGNLELRSPRWVPAQPRQNLQPAKRTAQGARVARTVVFGDQVGFADLL